MKIKRLTKALSTIDIPATVLGGLQISIYNNALVCIENHNGIIEFTPQKIRLKSKEGTIIIIGDGLIFDALDTANARVSGVIKGVELI